MSRIDPNGTGLTLGILAGGAHLGWVALVASGAASWVVSFVLRRHFIRLRFEIDGFDPSVAAFRVGLTTASGFALRSLLCAAGLALCACAAAPGSGNLGAPRTSGLDPMQQRGHDFAVRRCGGCHTVGPDDGGAQDGPPFRKLAMRFNPISLERRFAAVSQHGFDQMPPTPMTRSEAAELIAYFKTLRGN